jgi:ABC-type sugar transport system ATPase subunit
MIDVTSGVGIGAKIALHGLSLDGPGRALYLTRSGWSGLLDACDCILRLRRARVVADLPHDALDERRLVSLLPLSGTPYASSSPVHDYPPR